MVTLVTNVLTISLTVNWCILSVNIVHRLQGLVADGPRCVTFKPLKDLCRRYAATPWVLARTITEQFIVWLLVTMAVVAMGVTDVIRSPFRMQSSETNHLLLEIIFAVNIGKYIFITCQAVFGKHTSGPLAYRVTLLHHVVTLACYACVLAYRQMALLGLVGILMEITTAIDAVGRHLKARGVQYRLVAALRCLGTSVIRGIIPLTFLIISMLHQSPFIMDYGPLTIFFLSIVFFSVVNVWLILTSVRRSVRHCYSNEPDLPAYVDDSAIPANSHEYSLTAAQPYPGRKRNTRQFPFHKNNLGWIRPCDNKNLTDNQEHCDKTNLNNRKEYLKENIELNLQAMALSALGTVAYRVHPNCGTGNAERDGGRGADREYPATAATPTPEQLRTSVDSTDSAASDRPLFVHNDNNSLSLNNIRGQPIIHSETHIDMQINTFDRCSRSAIPLYTERRLVRSQSMVDVHIVTTDCDNISSAGPSGHL